MPKETSAGDFYHAFEYRYRGSRELIKSRLRVYVPFVEPLKSACSAHKAIDLGCGRGEWLELLQELGYDARGVDLDDQMLSACRQLGLNVQTEDVIGFLKALPSESQLVVSAFHLVEHIPFADLQTLVQEALRVLRPGGLLIMETPNPENIVVGATNFYLDPTHQRPIPPQLLSFLPEYYGFSQVKTLRLQEPKALASDKSPSLIDVFKGVSPDYAIVAQKGGDESTIAATRNAFATEYGLTLENLAARYDDHAERRVTEAEAKAEQAEVKAEQAEAKARQAEAKVQEAEATAREAEAETKVQQAEAESRAALAEAQLEVIRKELHDVHQANHHHWQLAEARQHQINALLNSTSWRITAPLRWVVKMFKGGYAFSRPRLGRFLRYALLEMWRFIDRWPRIKHLIKNMLRTSPRVAKFITRFLSPGQHVLSVYEAHRFEGLRSMRLMKMVEEIPNTAPSIIFLELNDDGE